jgi:hypothetical protein
MAQFIIIATTLCLLGFLITAFLAVKQLRENKKVKIRVVIDGKHVVYTFKPQTYEFEGFEIVPKFKVSIDENHHLEDYPTLKPINTVLKESAFEQKDKSIKKNFAYEFEYA